MDFINTWFKQLREYRLKHAVCDLELNLFCKQYGSLKLSVEEKTKYERAISVYKQQAALFHHIAKSLPELQGLAIIKRYGKSDKSADLLHVKEAGKELQHTLKTMLKSGDIEPIVTKDGFHIIRWLKPVKPIEQPAEDCDEIDDDLEELRQGEPIVKPPSVRVHWGSMESLMQPRR